MRFKEYLKFRKILNYYYSSGRLFFPSNEVGLQTSDLYYLQAKDVIQVTPYINGDPNCRITLTEKGLTYIEDRRKEQRYFWIPVIISLLALMIAFLSLVIDVAQLLLEFINY